MTAELTAPVVEATIVRTADEWVAVIKNDLSQAVDGIVAAGRNLVAAKADVRHGEWLPMLKQIGISQPQASHLMQIGGNAALSNQCNSTSLPTAMRALYELSRLPAEEIDAAIADGAITPDMTIKDAKEFARPEVAEGQCIHCREMLPLTQLYEGGQGYECDPCIAPDEQQLPPLPENYMDVPARPAPKPSQEPAQPRRRALVDAAREIGLDLKNLTSRMERLLADDRFARNKDEVAPHLRHYLIEAIKVCQDLDHQINN